MVSEDKRFGKGGFGCGCGAAGHNRIGIEVIGKVVCFRVGIFKPGSLGNFLRIFACAAAVNIVYCSGNHAAVFGLGLIPGQDEDAVHGKSCGICHRRLERVGADPYILALGNREILILECIYKVAVISGTGNLVHDAYLGSGSESGLRKLDRIVAFLLCIAIYEHTGHLVEFAAAAGKRGETE